MKGEWLLERLFRQLLFTYPRLYASRLFSHSGHRACHIADLPCGRHAPDEEWIAMLAADKGHWIVITGDYRIYRNKAQRAAFRASGLSGFVLAPAYQKTPVYQQASILLWRWPDMEKLMGLARGLYELPIKRTTRIKPLPL